MTRELRRKTPEEYLRECQAEEDAATPKRRGHLKIILGYASGVGKSFRMLDEARRRSERGQDVVIGAMQPQVPPEIEPLLRKLEVVPLKNASIDMDVLLRRRPSVCVIDGLAFDNPPGSRNPTRWQDVQDLLDADIQVIASINIQYVAELRDQVEAITGKHVDQTVPLSFIQSADEVEIVDAPPEEPIERSPDQQVEIKQREDRLSKLRELALVVTADIVDHQLNEYLERHAIKQHFGAHERILVCITPRANLEEMMEIAQIIAKRFHGELIVAYVKQANISPEDQAALDVRLAIANAAGAPIEILEGDDPADAILNFARARGITQLFVGHSQGTGLARLKASPLDKLEFGEGHGIDVCVFPAMNGSRGKYKIFMGYAAGVGKTYKMLEEAQELKASGVDIVIGYFEPHGRKETIAKTDGLEMIPRKIVLYRDAPFEEMDTEAILARNPRVCAVDEFPHTNVPGSERMQAMGRRGSVTRRWDRRSHHDEYPASGESERSHLADQWSSCPRNGSGLGGAAGRRCRDGGSYAAGFAQSAPARRRV